jgi:hypothetical protein
MRTLEVVFLIPVGMLEGELSKMVGVLGSGGCCMASFLYSVGPRRPDQRGALWGVVLLLV